MGGSKAVSRPSLAQWGPITSLMASRRASLSSRNGFPSRRSPSSRESRSSSPLDDAPTEPRRLRPFVQSLADVSSVVGVAVSGAGFYLWRLSQGSEVVWNRGGDWRPWDKVSLRQRLRSRRTVADSARSSRTRTSVFPAWRQTPASGPWS